ncbi:MAG: terminase small subunit [Methylophilaceae bacterium]
MSLIDNIDFKKPTTQKIFGEIVGISQPAVSDLLKRKVIVEGATLADWLRCYCSQLREQAAGRFSGGDLDLVGERARLAREQADRIAYQNAVTRNELAPVVLIEEVLARAASRVAGIFDAIPVALKRRCTDMSPDQMDLIATEIAKVRNIVAAISLADLNDSSEEDSADEPVIEV